MVSWYELISRQEDGPLQGGFEARCESFNFRPVFADLPQEDRDIYECNDTRAMGRFWIL